jgi:hypothetical protein
MAAPTPPELAQLERVVAITVLGALDALAANAIELDEARQLVFTPATLRVLTERGARPELLALVERGVDLDDVAGWHPERLAETVATLRALAHGVLRAAAPYPYDAPRWLDRYVDGGAG